MGQSDFLNLTCTINITSPLQNETFYTNTIPLNVSLETNVNASFTEWIVLYCNLDGTPHYTGGHGTQIGEFYPPLHSFYNTTINVPNGNHLVWAQVDYFTKDDSLYPKIENLSQIVNFTVTAPTPTLSLSPKPTPTSSPIQSPSLSPTPTVPEFSSWVILPLFYPFSPVL